MADETIRTKASRVIEDVDAQPALRELALEAMHWRLRDRYQQPEPVKAIEPNARPVRPEKGLLSWKWR